MDEKKNNISLIHSTKKEKEEEDLRYECIVTYNDGAEDVLTDILYFGTAADNPAFLVFGTAVGEEENLPPIIIKQDEVRKIITKRL